MSSKFYFILIFTPTGLTMSSSMEQSTSSMLWFFLNLIVFLPEFCTISKIIVFANRDIYFLIIKYATLEYEKHYHAFEVRTEVRPDSVVTRQEMLATYMPTHSIKPYGRNVHNGALFVAPRFMIPDDWFFSEINSHIMFFIFWLC